jgi:hypothetical protein
LSLITCNFGIFGLFYVTVWQSDSVTVLFRRKKSELLVTNFNKVAREGEKAVPRPSASALLTGQRQKYFSLGHKHLAVGNRVGGKEGFLYGRF